MAISRSNYAANNSRLRLPLFLLIGTHIVGTAGHYALWREHDGTLLDALFMTFITITTIGFGEMHGLGTAGRLLTMGLAATGIGSLFYTFSVVLDYAASDLVRAARRRRKMQKTLDELSGHYILAGLGRVGREAAAELREAGATFAVVDPGDDVEALAREWDCPWVRGDASEDAVLLSAGVKRARGLIVTTSSDATNLYVILSARLLNPDLFIASRAVDNLSVPKMLRAGANRAISPYAIGGKRLAHLMLSPRVVDFLETALTTGNKALNIDDVLLGPSNPATGKSIGALQLRSKTGATLLAVVRDGTPTPNPPAEFELKENDRLLVLGTAEQLAKLEGILR